MKDNEVIEKCITENRILITNDKDFGEKDFREGVSHRGIILLRLQNETAASKIEVLSKLLQLYPLDYPILL